MGPPKPFRVEEDYSEPVRAYSILFTVMTTLAIAARIMSRCIQRAKFGLDDLSIYIAYALNIGLIATCFLSLEDKKFSSVVQHTVFSKDLIRSKWIRSSRVILSTLAVVFVKLSFLFMYRRIFIVHSKWFSVGWWINFILLMPCYTVFMLTQLGLSLSSSTSAAYQRSSLSTHGPTIGGFFNAASDFMIIILPVGILWQSIMPRREKLAVLGIFSLGLVAAAVSLVRSVRFEIGRRQHWNPAYKTYNDVVLTIAETSVGIICACLVLLKPLLRAVRAISSSIRIKPSSWSLARNMRIRSHIEKSDTRKSDKSNSTELKDDWGGLMAVHQYSV